MFLEILPIQIVLKSERKPQFSCLDRLLRSGDSYKISVNNAKIRQIEFTKINI